MALSGGPSVDWILGGDAAPDEDLEPWQRVMRENAKKAKTERFIELMRGILGPDELTNLAGLVRDMDVQHKRKLFMRQWAEQKGEATVAALAASGALPRGPPGMGHPPGPPGVAPPGPPARMPPPPGLPGGLFGAMMPPHLPHPHGPSPPPLHYGGFHHPPPGGYPPPPGPPPGGYPGPPGAMMPPGRPS